MGRPKGSKNKPKLPAGGSYQEPGSFQEAGSEQAPGGAGRGRPKGSKNKVKTPKGKGPGINVQLINREGEVQEEKFVIIEAMLRREQTYVRVGKHLDRQAWDAAENLKYQAYKEAHKRKSSE